MCLLVCFIEIIHLIKKLINLVNTLVSDRLILCVKADADCKMVKVLDKNKQYLYLSVVEYSLIHGHCIC